MKNDKDHINVYSAADIQKYLNGEMSAEDMHALEKAALDDPFLADAIEGMEQAREEDPAVIDMQLNDLRRQLAVRTGTERKVSVVRSFRWWYAAAAASVVILAGIWLFRENASTKQEPVAATLENKKAEEAERKSLTLADGDSIALAADSVAAVEPARQPATGTVSDSYAFSPSKETTDKKPAKTTPDTKPAPQHEEFVTSHYTTEERASNLTPAKPDHAPQQDLPYLKKDTVVGNDKDGFFAKTSLPASRREEKLNELLRNRSAGVTLVKEKKQNTNTAMPDSANLPTEVVRVTDDLRGKQEYKLENGYANNSNLQNFIKGRVVDQHNNPISNAALHLENNKSNYATDQMGYFKIPATTDSVMNVSVNVVGYQPQQFKLNTQQLNMAGDLNNVAANNLRLQSNSLALNEAIVVGYGTTRKKSSVAAKAPSVMVQDAAPTYGWVLFEQYLQKNKRPPADNPLVTGEVMVSFTVDKKGSLSDFNIEQPLAKGYDEDAIRLIKEGPAWRLTKGRKAKITVIVRY